MLRAHGTAELARRRAADAAGMTARIAVKAVQESLGDQCVFAIVPALHVHRGQGIRPAWDAATPGASSFDLK
jgi:hypothetical protein